MRFFAVATAVALVLGACGSTASTLPSPSPIPTKAPTPTPAPTPVNEFAFLADLKASNEIPPIADSEASCTGTGQFLLRTKFDAAGKVIAAAAQFDILIRTCPESTQITVAHIHRAPAGQNGDVKVDSGLKASEPIKVQTGGLGGEIGITKGDIPVTDLAVVADIMANPANYYFNVHSVVHPGGLVRGQLVKS